MHRDLSFIKQAHRRLQMQTSACPIYRVGCQCVMCLPAAILCCAAIRTLDSKWDLCSTLSLLKCRFHCTKKEFEPKKKCTSDMLRLLSTTVYPPPPTDLPSSRCVSLQAFPLISSRKWVFSHLVGGWVLSRCFSWIFLVLQCTRASCAVSTGFFRLALCSVLHRIKIRTDLH